MTPKGVLLREAFRSKGILKIVGAHNGLGAKLIERHGFDGVWASGLEISSAYGLPDANILTMTENLDAARAINEATALPVICDCDTGYGNASNVKHMVKRYEAAGLAAVVIEDKIFPKVNSFVPGRQALAAVEEFVGRIRAAKEAQQEPHLMVFARVEALIAGWGMEEALQRAHAYLDAGADGIVIHSKTPGPEEVFTFAKRLGRNAPLVAIPTTYYRVTAAELEQAGFKMVIYANQGLRASIRAVETTLEAIQGTGTTEGIEGKIATLQEVFDLQGMKAMKEDEKKFSGGMNVQAVIPAARDHQFQPDLQELLKAKPLCMLEVGGKTILQRQLDALHSVGITDTLVIGGHLHERIRGEGARVLYNPHYDKTHCAHSILFAGEQLKGKTVVAYSDILFDRQILARLLGSPHAVTLVIDRAYQALPRREKALDLVAVEGPAVSSGSPRRLDLDVYKPIRHIGKRSLGVPPTHEFIGMAFLREEGLDALKRAWAEARVKFNGKPFYEARSVEEADFTDLIRYLLDGGFEVFGMEIDHGWSEIHSRDDVERAEAHFRRGASVLAEKASATA
ncbi:MAG: isocitrate lyase/phosphoenolpyruvate mutase family protein [Candidatus Omnitrophica bacterium]|nr:isocitrate lyase/phosphoenolpyruvate mutase family protein [Candidatus Omnitrophota bacterium]